VNRPLCSPTAKSLFNRRCWAFITLLSLFLSLAPPAIRADLGTAAAWSSFEADATNGVAWADCDGDGYLDLAVANDGQPNRVYRNDGNRALYLAWSSGEADESFAVAWRDYDRDGDPDLAVGNNYGQPNRLYRNDGNWSFTLVWSSAEHDWTTAVAWADYDRDGDPDLAVGNRSQPNRVYRNDGSGTFTLAWSSAESDFTAALAWGDYDGDGAPDVAVGNDGQSNRLYRNNGDDTFTLVWSSPERDWTTGLSWGDYDGDGDRDLAVGNAGQSDRVYRNDGGSLMLAWSSTASENTSAVAWGDWDIDGDEDLATANRGGANRIYENDAGTLTPVWLSAEVDYSTGLAWGNWDGDPDVELAVANWQAPNRVYDASRPPALRGTKAVDKTIARPNDTLRYSVTIRNTGSLPATSVRFTDTLPALVEWDDVLTVSPDTGSYGYNPAGRVITWTGDVAGDSAVNISYRATIGGGLADGTVITNTATFDDNAGQISTTPPVTTVIGSGVGPPGVDVSTTCSETVTFPLTVALGQHAIPRADVVFLFDRTGGMNDVTDEVIVSSTDIMNQVAALVGDAAFGAGYFADYSGSFSGCGYSDTYGGGSDVPWAVASDISTDVAAVAGALATIPRMGGGDDPDDCSRALWETLPAQGQFSWRPGSKKIAVLFGDAPPHDCNFCGTTTGPDPGRDEIVGPGDDLVYTTTVDQLAAADVTVFAIAYQPGGCASDAFDYVATATGGARYDAQQIDQVPQALVDLISNAVAQADLTVEVDPSSFAGWVSVSPPAYYDVPAMASRTFQVTLHAPLGSPDGHHTFDLVVLADGSEVGRSQVDMHLSGCDVIVPSIAKTVDRGEAGLGETLTYTIILSNRGVEGMAGVTVSDTLPAEVTWNGVIAASSGTATVAGGVLTWRGNVPAGGSVTIVYQATVNSPLPDGTRIVNTARLQEYGLESTPPAETTVLAPELRFSRKLASRLVAQPDDPITYTILLQNIGQAGAFDVLVTDTLPVNVTWDDALDATSGSSAFSGTTVTWNGDIAAGEQVSITYRAIARSPGGGVLPPGTLITNTATVDDHVFPPFETRPALTVIGLCQVAGDKTSQPPVVDFGDEVRVNLAITASCSVTVPQAADVMLVIDRSGSMGGTKLEDAKSAAQGFVAEMSLPPDQVGLVSFDHVASLDAHLTDDRPLVHTAIGALTAGGGTDIAAGITLAHEELAGLYHVLFNTPALVLLTDGHANEEDARSAADQAKAAGTLLFTIGLGSDADHDLLRELASSPDSYYYAPTSAGLTAIYAEIATVIGDLVGTDLLISDTLASLVTVVPDSFTGPLTPTLKGDDTLAWNAATIPPQRFDLGYRAVPGACGTYPLNEQALVAYRDLNGEPALFSLPSPAVTVRCGSVDARKQVDRPTVRPGETLTYTITITGVGDIDATQLVVTDTLPPGLVWADSLTATQGLPPQFTDGVVTWTGTVPMSASVSILYRATVSRTLANGTVIENTASFEDEAGKVYTTQPAKTRVLAPDLHPSDKTVSRSAVSPGESMTYTVILKNSGGISAEGACMTDTLPAEVSLVGTPEASAGSVGGTGRVITWTGPISTVAPVTVTFGVTVGEEASGHLIVNQAEVNDGLGRITTAGPVTTVVMGTHVVYAPLALRDFAALPDLVVSGIAVEPPTIAVSQPVTIYVDVTNVGIAPVRGPFWVDLYIDCDEDRMPPGPNETWPDVGCEYGIAWMVDDYHTPGVLPLQPGDTVTLDSDHYPTERVWSYWPGYFPPPPANHVLYAKADAYNGDVPYAAVLELDEDNNTLGPKTVTVTGTLSLSMLAVPPRPSLDPRPAPGTFSRP
jgi:uncharacterized repeat protein (TIGR01451 family)